MRTRTPYRADQAHEIAGLVCRCARIGVTELEMCQTASVSSSTWWRMKRTGRGFPRRVKALQMALRTLEQRLRNQEAYLP